MVVMPSPVAQEEPMENSETHSIVALCPECSGPMALSHIELAGCAYKRVFRCVACGHCDRIPVKLFPWRRSAVRRRYEVKIGA